MKSDYQRLLDKIERADIGIAKKGSLRTVVRQIAIEGMPCPTFKQVIALGRSSLRNGNWRNYIRNQT